MNILLNCLKNFLLHTTEKTIKNWKQQQQNKLKNPTPIQQKKLFIN